MSSRVEELMQQFQSLKKVESDLQRKMQTLTVSDEDYESVKHELDSYGETIEGIEHELWFLENPDKNIGDVLRLTSEVIEKILPILLRIFDSIRRRQSDASVPPELEEYITGLQRFGDHPAEWSKLVAMLQLPKEVPDSDKVFEVWMYKISWLSVIFFQNKFDKIMHSDYLSDFGLLMAIAMTNCDEYISILDTEKEDDLMIRDFFSECPHLDMISLLKKYPILFFKALDHPTIRSHFLENPELETSMCSSSCLETFHDHLSKIYSFFVDHHNARDFSAYELDRMISNLRKVCILLDVDVVDE